MATIISDSTNPSYDGNMSTANGFYRVEADNVSPMSNTVLALTTTRYINVTFANAGNCQGIVLFLVTISMTSREVTVNLQENAGGWTTRATKTHSAVAATEKKLIRLLRR